MLAQDRCRMCVVDKQQTVVSLGDLIQRGHIGNHATHAIHAVDRDYRMAIRFGRYEDSLQIGRVVVLE